MATHQLRRVDDRVAVAIALPGRNRPLRVDTEVRWIRENTALQRTRGPTGMGLRLVDLSDEASVAIQEFLADWDSLYHTTNVRERNPTR